MNYAERICSTIRSKAGSEVTVLQATFISPVAGTIYFRQSGNEPAVIHGSLFWVDGTTTVPSVEWTLFDDFVSQNKDLDQGPGLGGGRGEGVG